MSQVIKNTRQLPKLYYGRHFCQGTAEYREEGGEFYRIMLNEATLRDMDATFKGKPVYVQHVDEVKMANLQAEADGWVVRSFFNKADGYHWVEFLAVSDAAHQAIKNGFLLSNAYIPESLGPGGVWNGIEYQKEIVKATFEHMALVKEPRYDSIVLDEQQFSLYNNERNSIIDRIANSTMFKLFKKTEVDTKELADTVITLPSGKDVSIKDLIANASAEDLKANDTKSGDKVIEHTEHKASDDPKGDKMGEEEQEKQGMKPEEPGAAPQMANMDHHVMLGNESMPLSALLEKHSKMQDCMNTLADCYGGMQKKNDSEMDGGEKDASAAQAADLTKTNADEDGGEKEADEQAKKADKTRNSATPASNHFKALVEAPESVFAVHNNVDQLNQLERGKARYGSSN